jgi:hypothetical protein
MNGVVIGFPQPLSAANPPAGASPWRIRPQGLQMDFKTLLGKLERTQGWLDRNRVEVLAFSASTLRGATVCVRDCPRLRQLLKDEMHSTVHKQLAGVRFEQWQARDPSTGVTILWDAEHREGGRP